MSEEYPPQQQQPPHVQQSGAEAPPHQPAQPEGPPPQPSVPKTKYGFPKAVGVGLGAVVAIMIINSLAGGGSPTTPVEDPAPAAAGPAVAGEKADKPKPVPAGKSMVGLGQPARDGAFTFTVSKVAPGPKIIGSPDFGSEPQGRFIFVHLTVENHGDEAGHFLGDQQKLFDAKGREFSADTGAALYLDSAQSLFEEINPGEKVSGIVVFDVPKDVEAASLELHDSLLAGGVKVAAK